MDKWLKERLAVCLDFPIPDEMINFILSMKSSEEELDDYFQTLLNYDHPEHKLFVNDFKQRLFGKNPIGSNQKNQNQKRGNKILPQNSAKRLEKTESPKEIQNSDPSLSVKKKTKYVNLYTQDGKFNDTVLLKGRHHCDCQASKHKLINNCIRCGRIVCEQEGSGPCLFCGQLVCSNEETKLIKSSSKKGDHLKRSLMEQSRPKGWEEALAQRNRLLEYDRTSEKRTTVIDDESDYFKANSVWLSDGERKKLERLEEEMRTKKHASRSSRNVTIDFGGRQIIEEPHLSEQYEDHILQEIAKSSRSDNIHSNLQQKGGGNRNNKDDPGENVNPGIEGPTPIFINPKQNEKMKNQTFNEYDGIYNRVQDKELLEIQDMRHCISLHQPWASLLIAGIKRHEGRSWYTSHRGRLWIAATAKPVDIEDVKRMEHFYRVIYEDDNIEFPTQYPSGCLLGCVSVQDCLPQEEYRKLYPNGESESPFVFVCTNPEELPIRFPIKGMHKIYKLDLKIHTAAVKSLQRIAKLKAEN